MSVATHDPTYRLVRPDRPRVAVPQLDPAQRRVVDHPGGPLLVLAGPGTGKTTTLVEAAVDRITGRGARPDSVLMLTFSRRAAGELRDRVTARLARTTTEPIARTFHSYAFGLLRQAAVLRGEPPPRLLSGPEQDLVIRDLLRGDAEGDGRVRWPAALRPALLTRGFGEELRDLLLRAVERGIGPAELSGYGARLGRPDWRAAAAFLRQYLEVTALSGSTAYDPAELIRAAVGVCQAEPELLAAERARRRHVFVDEYQDTDPAQVELLRLLAAGASELVVVGDPDQSIYGFRGADPSAIRNFTDQFHGVTAAPTGPGGPGRPDEMPGQAGGGEVPVVALATTRRYGRTLVEASRRVAARLTGPAGHRGLRPAEGIPAGTAEVHLLRSASEEAGYIAHRLRAAHLRDGVPWSDMAVLVRSTGRTLPVLRRALVTAGVPLGVAGDDLPLVAQPGVAPLLLLMRCALSDETLDEDAALELLSSPLGGVDPLGLRRLRRALRIIDAAAGEAGPTLAGALRDPAALAVLPDAMAEPARRVAELLAVGRDAAAVPRATAEDVLWEVWSRCGLAERWQATSVRGGPAGAAADRDLDAVVALFDAAARFVDRLPASGPGVFLDYLIGQQLPGDSLAARAPQGEAVRVLTAHAAKGLEWAFVVVAGVQEGVWPDLRRRGTLLGSELLVDVAAGRDPTKISPTAPLLDEERRLFYVAVTRARRSLLVTAVRGEDEQPSRFLDEIDPQPLGRTRPLTRPPRTLSLPALVAELRATATDATERTARRRAAAGQLARLARAGVPGAHPDEWWGLAPLSDDGPLVGPGEQVAVSPSQVEKFTVCELRWMLETAGGTNGRGVGQAVGTVIHDLAALTGAGVTAEELAGRLDQALEGLDLGGPWMTRKERSRAHRLLGKFLAWQASSRGRWELVGVEVPFSVEATGQAVVRGRVDRLERDAAGRLVVVDLKTGRSAPKDEDVESNAQLGVYQLAVALGGFGRPAEPGGAALVQLGGSSGRPRTQDQMPLSAADDPQWARELVGEVSRGMSGGAFRATPGVTCRACPVRTSCPARTEGRQVGS